MRVRVLDLAVSIAYALFCIALISTMNPAPAQTGVRTLAQAREARSAISDYITSVGLPFLGSAAPHQICSTLRGAGNGTIVLGAVVDGVACSAPPTPAPAASNVTLSLGGRDVVVLAWLAAG